MSKKTKPYPIDEDKAGIVNEPDVPYGSAVTNKSHPIMMDGNISNEPSVGYLINTTREGIPFQTFTKMTEKSPFSLDDWSVFLHLSERTMQRYKKEKKAFDPIHSEKILEITMLYNRGVEVFGSSQNFDIWLSAKSIALGGIKPKELLDSTFGIGLLKKELIKIEHGVLA